MTLRCDEGHSGRLLGGTGGGEGPFDRLTVGMGGGGVLPGLCVQVSGLSFSPQTRLFFPQIARSKQLTRTHPDRLTITRRTTEGGGAEAGDKEREGGGVGG